MRESAEQKGRRYVAEGRLLIEHVDEHGIRARCRGGGAVYRLGFEAGEWSCDCPALTRCAHLVALQLVTAPAGRGDGPDHGRRDVRAGFEPAEDGRT